MSKGKRTVSKCPACGAPIDPKAMSCPYCDSQYVFEDTKREEHYVFEEFANAKPVMRRIVAAEILTAYNDYVQKAKVSKKLLIASLILTIITSGILAILFIAALFNFIIHSNQNPKIENLKPYILREHGMPKFSILLFFILFPTFIGSFVYVALYIHKYNQWKSNNQDILQEVDEIKGLYYQQAVALYR